MYLYHTWLIRASWSSTSIFTLMFPKREIPREGRLVKKWVSIGGEIPRGPNGVIEICSQDSSPTLHKCFKLFGCLLFASRIHISNKVRWCQTWKEGYFEEEQSNGDYPRFTGGVRDEACPSRVSYCSCHLYHGMLLEERDLLKEDLHVSMPKWIVVISLLRISPYRPLILAAYAMGLNKESTITVPRPKWPFHLWIGIVSPCQQTSWCYFEWINLQ